MKVNAFFVFAPLIFSCLTIISTVHGQVFEKGIVILVEFPDVKHSIDSNLVEMRFSRQLNNYIRQMSYNKVSLEIAVTKRWYTLRP